MTSAEVPWAKVTIEGDRWKWVRVSSELLAQLGEWSEPVRVKVITDVDDILDMVFERVER